MDFKPRPVEITYEKWEVTKEIGWFHTWVRKIETEGNRQGEYVMAIVEKGDGSTEEFYQWQIRFIDSL